jgi:catechol 2,3-dioxygenase-like lactoylglutathione lyase family enzyme
LIDHVTIRVSDFEASKAFYSAVLAPLGLGPPGERSVYHKGYYGAFVLDPERSNTLVTS